MHVCLSTFACAPVRVHVGCFYSLPLSHMSMHSDLAAEQVCPSLAEVDLCMVDLSMRVHA